MANISKVMKLIVCSFPTVGTSEIDLSSPLNFGTPSSMLGRTPRTPGAQGTPIRARPDVRSERKMRTVNVGGSGGSEAVSVNYMYTVSGCDHDLGFHPVPSTC